MRETLDELTKVAAALNRESDQLNAVIEDFEEQLEKAGVGVTVWLDETRAVDQSDRREFYDNDGEVASQESEARLLGYAKVDGKWRVVVKEVVLKHAGGKDQWGNDEVVVVVREHSGAPLPLAQAPRVVRVEAVGHLEALAKTITATMKDHFESIKKAKKLVKDG
jgi:hypothetical protein